MNENKKELIIPDEHLAVYQIITNSKEKYVTRTMILAQLDKDFTYGRRLSQIVNELVTVYRKPLGASSRKGSKGYFIIQNSTDKYLAKRDLQTKVNSLQARYDAIQNIQVKEAK